MNITTENIFEKISRQDFKELLIAADEIQSLPVEELYNDYLAGNSIIKECISKWEASLDTGKPAYELYNHNCYMNESFVCWKTYARRYLLLLKKYLTKPNCDLDISDVKTVLDLGCGCGYSTVGLKAIFPKAQIKATNLKDTLQWKLDLAVTNGTPDIEMRDENETFNLESVDLVFASEFFEHLTNPIEYLRKLINTYHPKYIIFANTFTQMSLGHFRSYFDGTEELKGVQVSNRFGKVLRDNNYVKLSTHFFNNRPYIYKLQETK